MKMKTNFQEEFKLRDIFKEWVFESQINKNNRPFATYHLTYELSTKSFIDKIFKKKRIFTMNIVTSHPGVMIGKAGHLVSKYQNKILTNTFVKEIHIIEADNFVR